MNEKYYRLLNPGEIQLKGDEWYAIHNRAWCQIDLESFGVALDPLANPVRRPCALAPEPIAFAKQVNPIGRSMLVWNCISENWVQVDSDAYRKPTDTHWLPMPPAPVAPMGDAEKAFSKEWDRFHGEADMMEVTEQRAKQIWLAAWKAAKEAK